MKTLLLLLFPVIAHCQTGYTGTIINKATKEKIAFASIGLIKENRGTNADGEGRFSLESSKYPGDSLIVSCVGFETQKFAVAKLPADANFELSEKEAFLKPVVMRSNRSSVVLNDFSNCGINSYTSSGSVTQVAQHFQAPVENALLSEVNICKRGGKSRFRIRVYDMDPVSKKPSTDLADTIIEVRSGSRHLSIDMEQYKIFIPGKDFFVAVEWLYIPENEEHVKMKINGEKTTTVRYDPYIFFQPLKQGSPHDAAFRDVWNLLYDGSWVQFGFAKNMLISAKMKY